jgi:pimeloyl-ACP methyl ester carboxylesterase
MQFYSEPRAKALQNKGSLFGAAVKPIPGVQPVSFGGCRGFLHLPSGASGTTGVVLCSPWGYEELVARHGWRQLAEDLAAAGFPSLRFDYPGTADSIGDLVDFSFEDWVEAARSACEILRDAGVTRLVLLGQSVGCLVACKAALDQPDIHDLVLLAPTTGRRYLRELAAWSSMLAEVEGYPSKGEDGGLAIAGFTLPPSLGAEIKSHAWTARPANWALLVEAPGRTDTAFANGLAQTGVEIERLVFDGLDEFVGDPTTSRIPRQTYADIVDRLRKRFGDSTEAILLQSPSVELQNRLSAAAYCEEAVYFGADASLFGLLCEPRPSDTKTNGAAVNAKPPAVLFLNTGRNAHTGWGRMTVEYARSLAAAGITSFRIDIASVGESPEPAYRPAQVLYTETPVPDVVAAIDILSARGFTAVALVGVCSGAYLGLVSALADPRVACLVAANLPRFAWGKSESIDAAIRFINRPNAQSVKRVLNVQTLRLILAGKLDPRAAIAFRLRSQARHVGLKLAPFIGPLSPNWPLYQEVKQRLSSLHARGVKVFLGFGANDEGVAELHLLFGARRRRLEKYPNMRLGFIENADHNLSQTHAREWLLAAILEGVGQKIGG